MDYKSTLNLPKTSFPMKADLPAREPEFLALDGGGDATCPAHEWSGSLPLRRGTRASAPP